MLRRVVLWPRLDLCEDQLRLTCCSSPPLRACLWTSLLRYAFHQSMQSSYGLLWCSVWLLGVAWKAHRRQLKALLVHAVSTSSRRKCLELCICGSGLGVSVQTRLAATIWVQNNQANTMKTDSRNAHAHNPPFPSHCAISRTFLQLMTCSCGD